jgi:hypothetical protein
MVRRLALAAAIAALVLGLGATSVLAAANPSGTGRPSQSCQAEPAGPPGIFSKDNGFARVAVNRYAGSGENTEGPANPQAISQYDVACYQFSQHHS